jgi:nicotinamide-nucleotide amidase
MQTEPRISVLGIGTELTQGQISNTNGQWISKRVEKFGVKTTCHIVVPDDRQLILDALKWCEERSDLVFVTGGLGPTSDDFTRELIAEHFQAPLEWHEASWKHIQAYLAGRGIETREVQKQQAYYPRSSQVLENDRGTAHGFHLRARSKDIFVLPGPPKEIDGLWSKYIEPLLTAQFQAVDAYQTLSWDCMGAGESELAARTEAVLGKHAFEIGYRVHLPYVEVKLTFRKSQLTAALLAQSQIDLALEPFVILKNGEDAAEKLCRILTGQKKVCIRAEVAGFQLAQRLQKYWTELMQLQIINFQTFAEPHTGLAEVNDLLLQIKPLASSKIRVQLHTPNECFETEIESRYPQANMQERQLQYYAEKAILFWLKKLE